MNGTAYFFCDACNGWFTEGLHSCEQWRAERAAMYPEPPTKPSLPQQASLPTDPQARKSIPIVRGLLDYFPLACAAVAEASLIATQQHHPGEEMHWDRTKSVDHVDSLVRHLMERGKIDTDKVRHSTKVAWRALAALQLELEEAHDR